MEWKCRRCYARVSGAAGVTVCPACGGELLEENSDLVAAPDGPPPVVDHRGIVLPRRHAVGGVITPR